MKASTNTHSPMSEAKSHYNFESMLRENNMKITPQRLAILHEIYELGHATVDDIYEKIRQLYPSISLATIYKNIIALQEVRIINELKLPNQKQRYELIKKPHMHLVCTSCGSIEDLQASYHDIQQIYTQQSGYQIHETMIAFMGICPVCQSNCKNKRKKNEIYQNFKQDKDTITEDFS